MGISGCLGPSLAGRSSLQAELGANLERSLEGDWVPLAQEAEVSRGPARMSWHSSRCIVCPEGT